MTLIGLTDWGWAGRSPGTGSLIENVSASGSVVSVNMAGSVQMGLPEASRILFPLLWKLAKLFIPTIDYDFDIELDFCTRQGSITGSHDGYPTYEVYIKSSDSKIPWSESDEYTWNQNVIKDLESPMEIFLNTTFNLPLP